MKSLKIWAYLDNFFFTVSKGGPKEKCWKNNVWLWQFFSIFPLVPPWKLWKKSCLNKLKFWEAPWNQKRSLCWKFKLSISLGTQKSAKTPQAVGKMIRPFVYRFEKNAIMVDGVNKKSRKVAEVFCWINHFF